MKPVADLSCSRRWVKKGVEEGYKGEGEDETRMKTREQLTCVHFRFRTAPVPHARSRCLVLSRASPFVRSSEIMYLRSPQAQHIRIIYSVPK